MSYAEFLSELINLLFLAVAQCGVYVFGLIILSIYSIIRGDSFTKTWALVQPFGFAALCVGWLAGNSSSPVLGTVLPAILTLLSGFLTFIFGQDPQARTFVLMGVPIIGLMLFIGTGMGSIERGSFTEFQEQQRFSKLRTELSNAAQIEFIYDRQRSNLRLRSPDIITTKVLDCIVNISQNDGASK